MRVSEETIKEIELRNEKIKKELSETKALKIDLEKNIKDLDNSDNITPSGGPEEEIKDDDNTDDVDSKFKKPNAKGFGALKRDSKIKKNYEKVSEEFIDTKSALVRDKDLGKGEVIPFNRKLIINKIEDTFGRTDLKFEDKVMDGKEVIVISRKVIVD